MMHSAYRTLGAAGAAVLFGVVAAGCSGGAAQDADSPEAEEGLTRTVLVEARTIEAQPFTEFIRVVGSVEADHRVTVAAEEGGVVRELLVENGSRVEAGRPLARIDDRLLRAQVEQAQAEAALAGERYERQRRLWRQEGVGTELAFLEAKYRAQQARASLDMLETRLERTLVRAPISGIVDARLVEAGATVSPGMPVVRMVDVDTLRVTAGVPERYAADVEAGTEASITFDFLDEEVLTGEIGYVGSEVDAQNRTFPIEIVVPRPGQVVKPGMVANVRITRRRIDDAILVPQDAVLRTADGYVVYVVERRGDGERVAAVRSVEVGVGDRDRVLVEDGLEAGDRLIVVGQKQVADGDPVQLADAAGGE